MKNMKRKDGGVLVMVMVVMLAFAILAVGLLRLHDTDALETVYVKHTAQAFWVAEEGLQRTLAKLRSSKSYREEISKLDEAFASKETVTTRSGLYKYNAAVWGNGSGSMNFVIESEGTVGEAKRLLRLEVELGGLGPHGLVGLGKGGRGSTIKKDCTLNCNVYQNGNLSVSSGTSISGNVYADNSEDFANGVALEEDQVLDLRINTTIPDANFLKATTTPVPGSGGTIDLADYADNTLVVSSSISLTNLIFTGSATEMGTLIVKSSQDFGNTAVGISSNINIFVKDNLDIWKNMTIDSNVHIYVGGSAKLSKDATVSTGIGCSLLVMGDLTIKKNLQFQGLIFAEGHVRVDKDLNVTGTLIAGDDYELKKDAVVTFNSGVIPEGVRDNMISGSYTVQLSTWNELPAK